VTQGDATRRIDDLDGDSTRMPDVLRRIHRRHTATTNFVFDVVAIGEQRGEACV
jgi:hypothetical protein